MEKFNEIFTPQVRRYIYTVLIALWPALAAAGVNLPGDQMVWFALAAAVLGVSQSGFTLANTMKVNQKTAVEFKEEVEKKVEDRVTEILGTPEGWPDIVEDAIVDTRGRITDAVEVIRDGR